MTPVPAREHLTIAEAGKQAALRQDYPTALRHYREAMRLAVSSGAPEVFFRHYLEATMESLELMGAHDSVLDYCERAIEHYRSHPPAHPVAWLDLASVHQRKAAVLLKLGETGPARSALELAVATAARAPAKLPLSERLLDWLKRGLTISAERVLDEQRRLRYFSVRRDTVQDGPLPPKP
ncbi:peptidylprolyl isomerase [Sorangium sp. So ce426]|uniref:peptidylprolyl isomerase n=1 Tax=Sorangium sp. So ce426 TaxID=3133312 RepID=UPI003F5B8640